MKTLDNVVAFEGIDGCGKTSQIELVKKVIEEKYEGIKIAVDKFPRDDEAGRKIREMLKQEDTKPEDIQQAYEQHFIESDTLLNRLADEYDLVLLDRHHVSNLAYGLARGFDIKDLKQSGYDKPRTLYIDVPEQVVVQRKHAKVESVYDANPKFLKQVRQSYQAIVPIMNRVNGYDDVDFVTKEIVTWICSNVSKVKTLLA